MDGINTANVLYRGWPDVEVQNEARRRATRKRRHNPAVAEYLGLGRSEEPAHLLKYAPPDDAANLPAASRKRRGLATGHNKSNCTQRRTRDDIGSSQQLVSQSFRIVKPTRQPTTNISQSYAADPPTSLFFPAAYSQNLQQGTPDPSALQSQCRDYLHFSKEGKWAAPTRESSEETVVASKSQNTLDFSQCDDHNTSARLDSREGQQDKVRTAHDEDDFDCGIIDDDLLSLMPDMNFTLSGDLDHSGKPTAKTVDKQAKGTLRDYTSVTFEQCTSPDRSKRPLSRFKSPLTQTSRLLAATEDVENPEARKPIARPPFPLAVRDRSPIIGLTSNTLLRTCFRIGEVINQSSQASTSKTGKAIIFELYARVHESERSDMQHNFVFCDLFHARPPYIKGTYHASIWKSVQLFEYDGRRLLQKGRICRCIGTTKRVEKGWVMMILNIWEATWEDIKWVEGIVSF
ncbi:hypothetical protein T440DRAFT_500341 [Plenodomus tracheiphilus IPT5]|uniref:Uncharacterized protein n=1 Tax=Plenodomus tracheiphilus IPT5 TaxID=1408161 RepID=A0A6A7B0S7_9PLEO|nr:hypothetical protein T440DRAFT_500341 [Plenodomus tracheiphilus IPT5]